MHLDVESGLCFSLFHSFLPPNYTSFGLPPFSSVVGRESIGIGESGRLISESDIFPVRALFLRHIPKPVPVMSLTVSREEQERGIEGEGAIPHYPSLSYFLLSVRPTLFCVEFIARYDNKFPSSFLLQWLFSYHTEAAGISRIASIIVNSPFLLYETFAVGKNRCDIVWFGQADVIFACSKEWLLLNESRLSNCRM